MFRFTAKPAHPTLTPLCYIGPTGTADPLATSISGLVGGVAALGLALLIGAVLTKRKKYPL
jgi:hypothetical protein